MARFSEERERLRELRTSGEQVIATIDMQVYKTCKIWTKYERMRPVNEIFSYTLSDILRTAYALLITKIFYRKARLVRRPFHLRGKKHLKYGKGFTTGYSCRIELFGESPVLKIGENCHLGDNVHMVASERVTIGDNFLSASKVFISDTSHGNYSGDATTASHPNTDPNTRELYTKPVQIGDNVWLGENVVVLGGASIGNGCIIGSNSVVTRAIPSNCIAVGSPAKPVKTFNEQLGAWVPYVQAD